MEQSLPNKSTCHYFVDEAGDGAIYNRKGQVIIGQEGVSRYFMLGLLDIPNPISLNESLIGLRQDILSDPYFKKIPSLQPQNKKTALFFHAKDDLPEIRREVFKTLLSHSDLRFFAVIRDKVRVKDDFTARGIRYNPTLLYDSLTSRLFRDRLHKEDEYFIHFASRGKADRTKALAESLAALQKAKINFQKRHKISSTSQLNVLTVSATAHPCLQAVDYFLWALQRLYERREDRYFDYIWPLCHLVHDVDDIRGNKRGKEYGVYYTQKNPLVLDKLPNP